MRDQRLALDAPYAAVASRAGLPGAELEPGLRDASLGEVLLAPTRIYVRDLLAIRTALVAGGTSAIVRSPVRRGSPPARVWVSP